ncbi:eno protein [Lactobacillus selangorensis]|uniref:Enolase n=1 Tax=Lactobacillus selangorensis TaxID=81857 RepID=A0A0R2FRH4_9LACO|nr:phosphopyruvate hydratase [Lactobacillus selangorensis]KRN28180.1 eno protein [Lactobacillus selangorensis]KRN30944.1 eno protein [Lactobacillus selangorensis]
MSAYIVQVKGREIYDSRGVPTVEADVILSDGTMGRAEVPSGKSTGDKEAVELRDGGSRLGGKGVLKAVNNINTEINDALNGVSPFDQGNVDQIMIDLDGTPNKGRLGANAILGVSMATARAAANYQGIPLYRYLGGTYIQIPQTFHNVINGGEHADNGIDMQEFMITPLKHDTFRAGFERIVNTYHALQKVLEEKGYQTGVGDEGGFAPDLPSSEDAIKVLYEAIEKAGYKPGEDVGIAFDAASSTFYDDKTGNYNFEGSEKTPKEMADYYEGLLEKYPAIVSMEDPFGENDWDNFTTFTKKMGDKVQIVTDDNVCTNPALIRKAIKQGMANSILIKLNQIGTVSETMEAVRLAHENNYTTMISHRSGDTGDTFVSDFAVAVSGGQLKAGAPARSERVEKYNELLRIEEELEGHASISFFPNDVDKD